MESEPIMMRANALGLEGRMRRETTKGGLWEERFDRIGSEERGGDDSKTGCITEGEGLKKIKDQY